ncbi:MAG: SIMPL domain-containing protein [Pirellulales bacterium]
MSRWRIRCAVSFCVVCCGFLVFGVANAVAEEPLRKIEVAASITNEVPITNVHYRLRVEAVKPTLAEAKKDVDVVIARLRERLKALPAEALVIQSRELELGRRYKHERDADPKFVGFYVERFLTVELKDYALTDRLETIFAESEDFSLSSRSFSNSDQIQLRHDARKSALEAAKRKARSMAEVLGMSIGAPLEISEGGAVRRRTSLANCTCPLRKERSAKKPSLGGTRSRSPPKCASCSN